MRLPNKIDSQATEVLKLFAAFWIPQFGGFKIQPRIYAVNQTHGYCSYSRGFITIPVWVFKDEEYLQEYLIHELTHWKDFENRRTSDHSQKFWDIFCSICPAEWWHYEEKYKPREFKKAGMHLLDVFVEGKRPKDIGEEDV